MENTERGQARARGKLSQYPCVKSNCLFTMFSTSGKELWLQGKVKGRKGGTGKDSYKPPDLEEKMVYRLGKRNRKLTKAGLQAPGGRNGWVSPGLRARTKN